MKSEVHVNKPPLRITITIGLFLSLMVVFLSWQYRWLFYAGGGVAILSIGSYSGIVISKRVVELLVWSADKWLDFREKRARIVKQEFEQQILTIPKQHRILHSPRSNVRLIEAIAEKQPMLSAPNNKPLPLLLDKIKNEDCIMFLGPRNSGKSETAAHWIKQQAHSFIVCNPVNEDFQWPDNCKTINGFGDIQKTVLGIEKVLNHRHNNGLKFEPTITLFFDEIHTLKTNGIDIITSAINIATVGRKFNIHCGFTCHGNTAKYLGVDSVALLANFTQVRITRDHKCFVDFGEGEIGMQSPGPYHNTSQIIDTQDFINLEVQPNQTEAAILTLFEQRESYNEIARQVFGNVGGKQTNRIKNVIAKFSDSNSYNTVFHN